MAGERIHPLQTLNSLRPLLLILVWLLALLPANALASIPRHTFTAPALPLASLPRANPLAVGEDSAPLTLRLDGLHDGGVLVRQNPWSAFDPEGLEMERCMMCHGRPWQERSRIGLPMEQPWFNGEGTKRAHKEMTVRPPAMLIDGVVDTIMGILGGPGKSSYTPRPMQRALGLPMLGVGVSSHEYRKLQDSADDLFLAVGAPYVFGQKQAAPPLLLSARQTIRVGRWMSQQQFETMQSTGFVEESRTGTTHVAEPANPATFRRQAPVGSVYAEFDVPIASVVPTSSGVSKIVGPNSLEGRNAVRMGRPVPSMPEATNIQKIEEKTAPKPLEKTESSNSK